MLNLRCRVRFKSIKSIIATALRLPGGVSTWKARKAVPSDLGSGELNPAVPSFPTGTQAFQAVSQSLSDRGCQRIAFFPVCVETATPRKVSG
jgi:hypothetical protein